MDANRFTQAKVGRPHWDLLAARAGNAENADRGDDDFVD
jgi:hypothetical protein